MTSQLREIIQRRLETYGDIDAWMSGEVDLISEADESYILLSAMVSERLFDILNLDLAR